MRLSFQAEDEVEAKIICDELESVIAHQLEDDESAEAGVTQLLPFGSAGLSPQETVEQLRRSRDLLILTRISQCFDLARELDKVAWVLEHRNEETFDLASYDWGSFMDRVNTLLGRKGRN